MIKKTGKNKIYIFCIIFFMLFVQVKFVKAVTAPLEIISESDYSTRFDFSTATPTLIYQEDFTGWTEDFAVDTCYNGYYYATHDTSITDQQPDTNFGTETTFSVIKIPGPPVTVNGYGYLQWEGDWMSGNPANYWVSSTSSAKLWLYSTMSGAPGNIQIYSQASAVNTATVTWNSPGGHRTPGTYETVFGSPATGWYALIIPGANEENLFFYPGSSSVSDSWASVESSNDAYYQFLSNKFMLESVDDNMSVINDQIEWVSITKTISSETFRCE